MSTATANAVSNEPKAKKSAISRAIAGLKKVYRPKNVKEEVTKAYKMGRDLGSGNFAVVKHATRRDNGQSYAIKIINKALCAGKEEMIDMELDVLRKVSHPHIIGMTEYFDTADKLYVVLDYVEGGELFDRIVDEGNFTEQDASRIMRQMTEAIQYLHAQDIVHRDLKPENLLFKSRGSTSDIMVTDFGLAKLCSDEEALKTACGTPNYVAPEILLQKGYGKEVDVWSLGVILFILLCGYPPFYDESDAALFQLIMKGQFEFDERYWSDISTGVKKLISNILKVNPLERLDTQQILAHPWITGKDTLPTVNLSRSISRNLKVHLGAGKSEGAVMHEGTMM